MGACLGKKTKDNTKNTEITQMLKKDRKKSDEEIKLLLLGAGESGKSTILKQMKMIYCGGYTKEEKESFRDIIFTNTSQSIKAVVNAIAKFGIDYENPKSKEQVAIVEEASVVIEEDFFPKKLAEAIKILYSDPAVKKAILRSNEYQLNDSAVYFFEAIDRISSNSYCPTSQDILRSRVKSTGIVEFKFTVGDLAYRMFDVGGQRSERKKWIHCFENVTALIFLVAISEYDQILIEDETVNRMQESLILFDSICNSRWFVKTATILFMNKIDIFKEKIARVPIKKYFPNYDGGSNYEEGTKYFINCFLATNQVKSKKIYPYLTCGTDTGQMKFVMTAVNNIIVDYMLESVDLV